MAEYYWTWIDEDGEIYDAEFETKAKAQSAATEDFAEKCERNEWKCAEENITLIKFTYDDEGERNVIEREEATVDYEHYHGDFAEHNTLWNAL